MIFKRKVFLIISLICSINVKLSAQLYYPELSFEYNWKSRIIDSLGLIAFRNNVNSNRRAQLAKQLPDFVKAWQNEAPKLFTEVFNCFKRGFKDKNRTAIIYLSNNSSYGSKNFLIIGLRYFLDPEPWLNKISREEYFTSKVFHELLHIWIDENTKHESKILKKYSKEHEYTIDHIYLMAIQKMVYTKLNRPDMLDMLDEAYCKFSLPSYKRAWEIVNDIEDYEIIIKEIIIDLK